MSNQAPNCVRQIVNLNVPCPIFFGDYDSRQAWEREVAEQLDDMTRRRIQFAVTPHCQVITPTGRVIKAGEPIAPEDMQGGPNPGPFALCELVRKGLVLEASLPDEEYLKHLRPRGW